MTAIEVRPLPDPAGTLRGAHRTVDPHLREVIGKLDEPVRTLADYHFGWWDPQEATVS